MGGGRGKKMVLFFFTYLHQRFNVIFFGGSYPQVMAYQGQVSIFVDVSPIWSNSTLLFCYYYKGQLDTSSFGNQPHSQDKIACYESLLLQLLDQKSKQCGMRWQLYLWCMVGGRRRRRRRRCRNLCKQIILALLCISFR